MTFFDENIEKPFGQMKNLNEQTKPANKKNNSISFFFYIN